MAIIVPILVSYGATALGVAATTATMMATAASVVFQVTGINNKINKAASKVFGEDLVMIANIAGAVYGAVNGGFGGGGADAAAAATDASSAMAVNGMDAASDAFSAAGGLASDGFTALSSTSDASSLLATNGMDAADNAFNLANKAAGGGLASDGVGIAKGVNLMDSAQSVGTDTKKAIAEATTSSNTAQTGAAASDAAGAKAAGAQNVVANTNATGANAAGANASSGQQLKAGDISKVVEPPKTASTPATTKPGSFFDRLLSSEKGMGAVVQGVGGALSSAAQSKAQKETLDFAKRKYHSVSGVRVE